jgi:hypothetical protein
MTVENRFWKDCTICLLRTKGSARLCRVPLKKRTAQKHYFEAVAGLWEDLNTHISEEDIAKARREIWGSFPA